MRFTQFGSAHTIFLLAKHGIQSCCVKINWSKNLSIESIVMFVITIDNIWGFYLNDKRNKVGIVMLLLSSNLFWIDINNNCQYLFMLLQLEFPLHFSNCFVVQFKDYCTSIIGSNYDYENQQWYYLKIQAKNTLANKIWE